MGAHPKQQRAHPSTLTHCCAHPTPLTHQQRVVSALESPDEDHQRKAASLEDDPTYK